MLLPVREFLKVVDVLDVVTDHDEFNKLFNMLTTCNERINLCVKNPPGDVATKEAIIKMHKALDSAKSFMLYSMFQTVEWVPQQESVEV